MDFILYYNSVCPFSRKIRFLLDDSDINYTKVDIAIWNIDKEFTSINPANETPVLYNEQKHLFIYDSYIIAEYLNNISKNTGMDYLTTRSQIDYLEAQRLHMWFDKKFYREVTQAIIEETFYKTFRNNSSIINSNRIKAARFNLDLHLNYMDNILVDRKWLASEFFSIADIAASTQISILDYLGYINWKRYFKLKTWYSIIKSKKGFKNILLERIGSFNPSVYYNDPDF